MIEDAKLLSEDDKATDSRTWLKTPTEEQMDRVYRDFEANVEAAEAAETYEEKLALLERSLPHDRARCFLAYMLDPSLELGCVHVHESDGTHADDASHERAPWARD